MSIRIFKYLSPLTLYILAWFSFSKTGFFTWLPLAYAWVLLPVTELFLKPDATNLQEAEEDLTKHNKWFDYMLYVIVVYQYITLIYFLQSFYQPLLWWETLGRIFTMGLLCGTFGINVAHELGHRKNKYEQWMAKALLTTSLYAHFFIEHNKGHHKNVATLDDPSSARYNEPVYTFYFRTIFYSYLSAWKIANSECHKKGYSTFSFQNEMIQAHIIQMLFMLVVFFLAGWKVTLYFLASASIGILLLETVNYIEHYGLQRRKTITGYERALPCHSWNSNHILGRIMLFELSRHSDHHFMASRKYQLLKHHDNAPQLPTGYPGSMILALIPPAWFYVMNKKINNMTIPFQPQITQSFIIDGPPK